MGGFSDIYHLYVCKPEFVESPKEGSHYQKHSTNIDESLYLKKFIVIDTVTNQFSKTELFTYHK